MEAVGLQSFEVSVLTTLGRQMGRQAGRQAGTPKALEGSPSSREGGAGVVTGVQLGAPGPVFKGRPVTLTGCFVNSSHLRFSGLNSKELCLFSGPSRGATGACLNLGSQVPLLWLEKKHLKG